jgi:hypothetical protein
MRAIAAWLVLGSFAAAPSAAQQQVEIDRTLQRISGVVLMAADVRQARLLKLVPAGDRGDESIQTALENRLLVLRELSRVPLAPASDEAVAARRKTWEASFPAGTDLPALMTRAGMSDKALEAWLRDEIRIEEYIDQRFGQLREEQRATRTNEWIRALRHRAGLAGAMPGAPEASGARPAP